MVKGATAGDLLADSIERALDWEEWTIGMAEHAAHTDRTSISMAALAKAHGASAEASNRPLKRSRRSASAPVTPSIAVARRRVTDMSLSN